MGRPKNILNLFKPDVVVKKHNPTGIGEAGYDNPRENIDPHIKTSVVSTKELVVSGATLIDTYLAIDGSNANQTIDIGSENLYTTGILRGSNFQLGTTITMSNVLNNLIYANANDNKDIVFTFKDGGVAKSFTIDASENTLNLGTGNFTTTGSVTCQTLRPQNMSLGSVVFVDGTGLNDDNGGLYFDAANNELGINTNTPDSFLDIEGDGAGNHLRLTHASGFYNVIERASTGHLLIKDKTGANPEVTMLDITNVTGNTVFLGTIDSKSVDITGTLDVSSTGVVQGKFEAWGAGTQEQVKLMHSATYYTILEREANGDFQIRNRAGSGDGRIDFMIDATTGGVGINTITPDTLLQVVGDCKFGDDNTNYVEIGTTGDLVFVGSSGLPYGCLSGLNETITCTTQNTWYQVTFDAIKASNNTTPSTANNDITILKTGDYLTGVTACFHTSNAQDIEILVKKENGTVDLGCHLYQTTGVSAKVENASGTSIVPISATDTMELWVRCTSSATIDVIFDRVNLNCTQVGG